MGLVCDIENAIPPVLGHITSAVVVEQKAEETLPPQAVLCCCYSLFRSTDSNLPLYQFNFMCMLNWKQILKVMISLEKRAIYYFDFSLNGLFKFK